MATVMKTEFKKEVKQEIQKGNVILKTEVSAEARAVLKDFKPGQKRETPPPASGTRVFYESLYQQRKSSFMALKWCVEHGVLRTEECEAAVEELERRKKERKEKASNGSTSRAHLLDKEESPQRKKSKKISSSKHRRAVEFDGGDFEEAINQTTL